MTLNPQDGNNIEPKSLLKNVGPSIRPACMHSQMEEMNYVYTYKQVDVVVEKERLTQS